MIKINLLHVVEQHDADTENFGLDLDDAGESVLVDDSDHEDNLELCHDEAA